MDFRGGWLRFFRLRLVRTTGDTPTPDGHGGFGDYGVDGEGGVDDGEARAPLEIGDEGGAELGVRGELEFIGRFEEEGHPALALLVCDVAVEMMADHFSMPTVEGGVIGGSTEDFGDELGDVLEVLRGHTGKDRREDRVVRNFLVEACHEPAKGLRST